MTDWIDRFRASVSWGDELTAALLPDGTAYCWLAGASGRHGWVPGLLQDLPGAITRAQQAGGCSTVAVLFLDQQATAAQVEEACHQTAKAGIGCGFLEPQPAVLRDGLLLLASEGTVLDAVQAADC